MATKRITKRIVDSLKPGETVWDSELSGFGVRCQRRDKVYGLKTRVNGRQRWFTIGKHGAPWAPDTARRHAMGLLGEIARGGDPSDGRSKAKDLTVGELANLFLAEHVDSKRKASTATLYRDILNRIVVPKLGKSIARNVKHADVAALHHGLQSTPYQANRTVAVLSKMFSCAEARELVPKDSNPCRHIEKYREHARERFLTSEEINRLADAIQDAEQGSRSLPSTIAAIRLLLFTGARRNEILTLKWQYVDFERSMLFLPDSKTGRKPIHLNALAVALLGELPRVAGNDYVLPGRKEGGSITELKTSWRAIRSKAGLDGVRLHDIRHTFASIAAGAGASLHMIGKLLGHRNPATTQRYAHLANDPMRSVGQQIADTLEAALRPKIEAGR